jgi:pyruvate dehydrogenase E2 component (dihydrolipoamide acetyltransferase)
MSTEVTLPALGESITEGTVTRWLKQVGDTITVDEPLLEISTDKVDTEIPSPVAGTLLEIRASEDETVEVGGVLAVIGSLDTAAAPAVATEPPSPEDPAPNEPATDHQSAPVAPPEPAATPSASVPGSASEGVSVTLPALGESITEGTVTRWLKQVGDTVTVDEPLLEISTDKVDTEIPSPVAGTLLSIAAAEDETVEVGAELAVVGPLNGSAEPAAPTSPASAPPMSAPTMSAPPMPAPPMSAPPASAPPTGPTAAAEPPAVTPTPMPAPVAAPESPAPTEAPASTSAEAGGATYVTPLVRKMAAKHSVDLTTVTGTGVGGRIRKQDVLDAAKAAAAAASTPAAVPSPNAPAGSVVPTIVPSPLRGTTAPLSRLRKVIAARMVESLQVSAQLTSVVEVDVTPVARLRNAAKDEFGAREGVKLSFLPFFAKATVDALKQHPTLNAAIDTDKGEVTYFDRENLAIAVDTERGLLTPVIKEAGDLSIAGLARKIADVAERTRTNKITPDELSGGTFTLTNTGSRGALFDTPILNQPQVAILGTGSIVKRPVVIDDPNLGETIAVRHMVYLSLTYDHRLVDGADAARFLVDVKKRLEAGSFDV